ncbi:metallophosphoesterase family protein [Roseibium sp. RKSG952]|uniref:metallophosphoesterase family protein n=1 Tax=Roseibium sp. RKSG952 TaxID=2529384 RepID=UPI0012BD08E1|nr:metallophosphoesterase family protein [Roseibium sp. RKSG952]MTI00812.1 serine/threonine protein phosphatase [Roseibium sp. RKSG952]
MIKEWIRKLAKQSAAQDMGASLAELAPDQRFYAVGDIHGRLDLLQTLLPRLDRRYPLVFVGDYIDRGEYSAQVLHHLKHLSEDTNRQVVCLLGNHEEMLLKFVDDPKRMGRLWLQNGGLQTLASFGLGNVTEAVIGKEAVEVAERLRARIGDRVLDWLRGLPLTWSSGNVTVVHAALDPAFPLDDQPRQVCLWGHPRFRLDRRTDDQWVVHGHTIVSEPRIKHKIVSIDTGAFATGRLTAAEISTGEIRFISADQK